MRIDKSRGFTDKVQITKEEEQKKDEIFILYSIKLRWNSYTQLETESTDYAEQRAVKKNQKEKKRYVQISAQGPKVAVNRDIWRNKAHNTVLLSTIKTEQQLYGDRERTCLKESDRERGEREGETYRRVARIMSWFVTLYVIYVICYYHVIMLLLLCL